MSDQEPKHNEKPEEASATVVATTENQAVGGSSVVTGAASPPRKTANGVAWLALLLVVVLAAGAAWVLREGQNREAALAQRVAELETGTAQKQSTLDGLESRFIECQAEKNCTLIRYDIIQSLRNVYEAVKDEGVKAKALELIETEDDLKYRKKYASLWKVR